MRKKMMFRDARTIWVWVKIVRSQNRGESGSQKHCLHQNFETIIENLVSKNSIVFNMITSWFLDIKYHNNSIEGFQKFMTLLIMTFCTKCVSATWGCRKCKQCQFLRYTSTRKAPEKVWQSSAYPAPGLDQIRYNMFWKRWHGTNIMDWEDFITENRQDIRIIFQR